MTEPYLKPEIPNELLVNAFPNDSSTNVATSFDIGLMHMTPWAATKR